MTKDEMKDKYSAFITEISEIMGLGKPIDIIKLCVTIDLFFQPLEKQIAELEEENEELKKLKYGCETSLCRAEYMWMYGKFEKAKKIVGNLYAICKDNHYPNSSIPMEQAEHFLKEVSE